MSAKESIMLYLVFFFFHPCYQGESEMSVSIGWNGTHWHWLADRMTGCQSCCGLSGGVWSRASQRFQPHWSPGVQGDGTPGGVHRRWHDTCSPLQQSPVPPVRLVELTWEWPLVLSSQTCLGPVWSVVRHTDDGSEICVLKELCRECHLN